MGLIRMYSSWLWLEITFLLNWPIMVIFLAVVRLDKSIFWSIKKSNLIFGLISMTPFLWEEKMLSTKFAREL